MVNLVDRPSYSGPTLAFCSRVALVLAASGLLALSAKEEHERARPKDRPAVRKAAPAKEGKPGESDRPRGGDGAGSQDRPRLGEPGARPAPAFEGRGGNPNLSRPGGPAGGFGGPGRPGPQIARTPNGGEIRRSPSGAISEVRTAGGGVVQHTPFGGRVVQMTRPDGRIVMASGSGRFGYVQRPLVFQGQPFLQRTYVVNGVNYPRFYRPWAYGGRVYPCYAPMHYYRPAFYSWAYAPWGRPVNYRWGWYGRPWYGYYGGYFAPYPVYLGPSFWLADFIIASTLETAYLANNYPAGPAPVSYDNGSGMTPEVKQAIADEVRRQMDRERADQAAYQNPGQPAAMPPLFSDQGPRVFIVATGILGYAGNRECPLGEGAVLGLVQTPVPGSEWAQVKVLANRGDGCPRGTLLSVKTMDLQEMQNHMQATLDQGLDKLHADQGKDGIPALPPGAGGSVDAAYASQLQAEDKALDDLTLALQDANQSEQQVLAQGAASPAPPPVPSTGQPGTITRGMTVAQVLSALGQPRNTVDLGPKQIYLYENLKVVFRNGRVVNVQ